jgi:hypothetical protein
MDALVDATPKRQALIVTTIPATIADTQQPGFFILSQSGERPERYVESFRFDTMPSSPSLQAWRNTISPSSCFCINATVAGGTGLTTPGGHGPFGAGALRACPFPVP